MDRSCVTKQWSRFKNIESECYRTSGRLRILPWPVYMGGAFSYSIVEVCNPGKNSNKYAVKDIVHTWDSNLSANIPSGVKVGIMPETESAVFPEWCELDMIGVGLPSFNPNANPHWPDE